MQNDAIPQEGFGSATPELEKQKKFTSLTKEQILPILVAIFGCLTLVFLVSTIALAVNKPNVSSNTVSTVESNVSISTQALSFSIDKIANKSSSEAYKLGTIVRNSDDHQVVTAFANTSGTGLTFEVNWEFANAYYSVNSTRVDQETFKISTNGAIADIVIGRSSNDPKDDVLLIFLNDGTIQYMPIRNSLENYSFRVVGVISDVSEVVKYYRVYETVNNELIETIMVQQVDGKIVDLRPQLLKIVGKDIK